MKLAELKRRGKGGFAKTNATKRASDDHPADGLPPLLGRSKCSGALDLLQRRSSQISVLNISVEAVFIIIFRSCSQKLVNSINNTTNSK